MAVLRRSRRNLKGGLFGAVAVAASLLIPASAGADKVTLNVETQMSGQAKYSGKVKARNDRCVRNRAVQAFDVSEPTPLFIGATKTHEDGNYELIEFAPLPGHQVQVIVPEAKKGKHRCGELRRTAPVPPPSS